MPTKARRMCKHQGCSTLTTETYCPEHKQAKRQQEYRERDNKWLHLYHDPRWQNPVWGLRVQQLTMEPLCAECLKVKQITVATIADHVVAHKGDANLFFDPDNLQSLCERHHNLKTLNEGAFGRPVRG